MRARQPLCVSISATYLLATLLIPPLHRAALGGPASLRARAHPALALASPAVQAPATQPGSGGAEGDLPSAPPAHDPGRCPICSGALARAIPSQTTAIVPAETLRLSAHPEPSLVLFPLRVRVDVARAPPATA